MFEKALGLYIYADTPVHTGSGIEVNSPVDLPIQRERHTSFPIIPGSGLKGVMKQWARDQEWNGANIKLIFGPDDGDEGKSGIAVTDAKILAYPVRTMRGVFGWITCPLVLDRFKKEMEMARFSVDMETPSPSEQTTIVGNGCSVSDNDKVVLEDLVLDKAGTHDIDLSKYLPDNDVYRYIKNKIQKDLVVVDNSVFTNLVELTTEVVARTKIDPDKGTVAKGALWYEEYLPSDTLLYSLLLFSPKYEKDNNGEYKLKMGAEGMTAEVLKLNDQVLHIGGDETVGKGFTRVKIVDGGKNEPEKS